MPHPAPEQLFALYDRELSGDAARAVEAHLAQCQACLGTLARWKQAAGLVFVAPAVTAADALVTRVMRRLQDAPRRAAHPAAWRRWVIPALGFAAVLAVALRGPLQPDVATEQLLLSSLDTNDAWWDTLTEDGP